MSEETTVRALLARAADDLPPAGVQAESLVVAGERAVHRRRWTAMGAAAAVTAVALLGVAVLLGVRPATAPTPADRDGTWPAVAPTEFDPTRQLFRLTWLPEAMSSRVVSGERRVQWLNASAPGRPLPSVGGRRVSAEGQFVSVTVGARGVDLFQTQRDMDSNLGGRLRAGPTPWETPPGASAAPVQGRPAYQHTGADGRYASLSWQYAPGAWVTVMSRGLPRPEETLRRVAEGLVWERQPFRVPFLPVTPPKGARLDRVVVDWRDGRWHHAQVGYLAEGSPTPHEDLSVGVSRDYSGDRGATVVAGRPAWVDGVASGVGSYRVGEPPGACPTCVAEVSVLTPRGFAVLRGREGALNLAAAVRPVADPDDETTWRPL